MRRRPWVYWPKGHPSQKGREDRVLECRATRLPRKWLRRTRHELLRHKLLRRRLPLHRARHRPHVDRRRQWRQRRSLPAPAGAPRRGAAAQPERVRQSAAARQAWAAGPPSSVRPVARPAQAQVRDWSATAAAVARCDQADRAAGSRDRWRAPRSSRSAARYRHCAPARPPGRAARRKSRDVRPPAVLSPWSRPGTARRSISAAAIS